ncbi:MAG: molybdenum cofactor biosysynthesis protein [Verrucomicrobia bacterium]|nr:molybdenum cofactor biosysynthesis protein [Verrucomicrobiota bacterium]
MAVEIVHLYRSPGHNFVGRHGKAPREHPMVEEQELGCEAGRGIQGDRYFDFRDRFKGQVTFFAWETHEDLCNCLRLRHPPSVYRRNIITRGIDLNQWIKTEFEIQGIRFEGTEEASPCYWMNTAFGPGAEDLLKGRGGLRARILSSGALRTSSPVPSP